jgi:hypothetical protein
MAYRIRKRDKEQISQIVKKAGGNILKAEDFVIRSIVNINPDKWNEIDAIFILKSLGHIDFATCIELLYRWILADEWREQEVERASQMWPADAMEYWIEKK